MHDAGPEVGVGAGAVEQRRGRAAPSRRGCSSSRTWSSRPPRRAGARGRRPRQSVKRMPSWSEWSRCESTSSRGSRMRSSTDGHEELGDRGGRVERTLRVGRVREHLERPAALVLLGADGQAELAGDRPERQPADEHVEEVGLAAVDEACRSARGRAGTSSASTKRLVARERKAGIARTRYWSCSLPFIEMNVRPDDRLGVELVDVAAGELLLVGEERCAARRSG